MIKRIGKDELFSNVGIVLSVSSPRESAKTDQQRRIGARSELDAAHASVSVLRLGLTRG